MLGSHVPGQGSLEVWLLPGFVVYLLRHLSVLPIFYDLFPSGSLSVGLGLWLSFLFNCSQWEGVAMPRC